MKRQPVPRPEIYHLYWYFAAERQGVFERRVAGEPPPWTNDEILHQYKFCNVYRAADRVSQYLIREVAYHPAVTDPVDRLFQIVAFRMFSNIDTWRSVYSYLGRPPTVSDLADGSFTAALDHTKRVNGRLYTGAFILAATDVFGHSEKHRNHIELFRKMFLVDDLAQRLLDARSLRGIYELLHRYPLLGDFMSYQISIDLNYSDIINFDENDFTQAGPGAIRGISKVFTDIGDWSTSDVILWMVDRQQIEFSRLGLPFKGLWGRPLHAIDCQGLFCEVDKYCRIAVPELVRARTRMKAKFAPTAETVRLFFPPKWRLNDYLPTQPVLGRAIRGSGVQGSLFEHDSVANRTTAS